MESHGEHDGSARRRRMRRLRQWQRHERMTVAMALAEATHHAAPRRQTPVSAIREEVEHATHSGPRARRLHLQGSGRASLRSPGRRGATAACGALRRSLRRSAGESLRTLALSSLAGSAGEEISTLSFLTRSILKIREEEEKVQAMREEVRDPDGWNQATGSDGVQFFWHRRTRRSVLVLPPSASRRKRKKRRKKKLPRSGRTRRRHRQWRVRHAVFAGSNAPRDVFPVADDWPLLLGNTAGMDQKDSIFVVVIAVAYARLVLLVSLVPLCSLLSRSGPDAPHHGRYQPEGLLFSGLVLLVILHLALCFLPCCQSLDACRQARRQVCIMAGMDQKEGYVVPCRKLRKIRSCCSSARSSSSSSWCRV